MKLIALILGLGLEHVATQVLHLREKSLHSSRPQHAGKSSYCGREECNDFSVGIELEGTDESPYQYVQYERLAELVRILRRAYPSLQDAEIVGHNEIAPGRKTDPGACFDWKKLGRLLES